MALALSTRWMGHKPFTAPTLLETLRSLDLRGCALSASVPGPAPGELDRVLRPAGARVVALELGFASRGDEPRPSQGVPSLVAASDEERSLAFATALRAAAAAKGVGSRCVVLRLGAVEVDNGATRDEELLAGLRTGEDAEELRRAADRLAREVDRRLEPWLDRACRGLFDLCRREPELRFAIATPAAVSGFPTLRGLSLLFDEVSEANLGYWHDVGNAALQERLGVAPPNAWGGDHSARAFGVSLHDVVSAERQLPPGAGSIDFRAVRDLLPRDVPGVIDVDGRCPIEELRLAVSLLRSVGY